MLGSLITPSRVKLNLESTEWDECFSELLEVMIENNPKIVRTQAISALVQREEKMSTAVFPSVAVPHATCNSVNETQIVLGISSKGVDFEDLNNSGKSVKVNLVFQILFDENNSAEHLHVLKDILELVKNPKFLDKVLKSKNEEEVCKIIQGK